VDERDSLRHWEFAEEAVGGERQSPGKKERGSREGRQRKPEGE
jgi:hypothetical protein